MFCRSITRIAAENIARKRKACGLTQLQVAERLSVEKESISRMESGKIALSLDRLQQFASLYGCSVSELLRDSSLDADEQAQAIMELLRPLGQEEREAVFRFVGEAVRLFQVKSRKERS